MKSLLRWLAVSAVALCTLSALPALAAKDVVFAVASTFTTTDPYDANDTLSQAMAKSFYEGLYGFDKDMKLIPVLAESYEVSKDGLVYTIKLKHGIKFHDGTDFRADAVKANFDRVTNPDNKLKRYGLYSNIGKTEVVDEYTARITLKTPFSPFINQLAHPSGVMISPTALKQWGSKDIAFHPVGTGPFKFVEWKQTDYLKVAKFDGYWKKGYPKVDTITWKPVVDNNSRAALMETGEAHFTFPVPYEQADVLKARPDLEVVAAPSIVLRYLAMNTLQKPFDNPKVRQAIFKIVDRAAIADIALFGHGAPTISPLPPFHPFYDHAIPIRKSDPAAAKALLAEGGFPDGITTQLVMPAQQPVLERMGVALRDIAKAANITIDIRQIPEDQLTTVQRPMAISSFFARTTPDTMLYEWYHSTGSWNRANWHYSNPEVDKILDAARQTGDPAEQKRLYTRFQEFAVNEGPGPVLFVVNHADGVGNNVKGFAPSRISVINLKNVTLGR